MATILQAFDQFPIEGMTIGKLLAGYGEIELEIAVCASEANGGSESPLKACFRARGENQRLEVADSFIRPALAGGSNETFYSETFAAAHNCRKMRNTYAHCHWLAYKDAGLFFTNMENAAEKRGPLEHTFRHLDWPLLEQQESYFRFVLDSLRFIADELRRAAGRPTLGHAKPARTELPPAHNAPEKHPLPA